MERQAEYLGWRGIERKSQTGGFLPNLKHNHPIVSPSGLAKTSLRKPGVAWVHRATEAQPHALPSHYSICIIFPRFQVSFESGLFDP